MSTQNAQRWVEAAARAKAEDPTLSPCIGVCAMDAQSGLCQGCLRTLDEIAAWASASEAQRRAIKAALPQRRSLVDSPDVTGAP